MDYYAEAIVGVPGQVLNVEQRKRLSIALEMVARPDLVLFLGKLTSLTGISTTNPNTTADEPTSGLDSQTSWSICTLLRKLVDNGQTILCTIHQPSSQTFGKFDRLLLLQDGATIYFGDIGQDASKLVSYFEQRGARRCLPGENPADWLLDVTQDSSKNSDSESWSQTWTLSQERQAVLERLKEFDYNSESSSMPSSRGSSNEFAAPFTQQLLLLVQRYFRDQWRSPTYLYTKTATCTGLVCCPRCEGVRFCVADNTPRLL